MDKEVYNDVCQIFEKFDPIRLQQHRKVQVQNNKSFSSKSNQKINQGSSSYSTTSISSKTDQAIRQRKLEKQSKSPAGAPVVIRAVDVGPATPMLDVDALKDATKKQGLKVEKKKKIKRER